MTYILAASNGFTIARNAGVTDIDIDNLSIKECGWADSQAIYDYYISVGKSVLEATKAAAMFCKYNNSDDNAAVYGYILNGHANNYFKNAAPKGLRLGLNNDWTQLFTTLGGNSVAGKKLKKRVSYIGVQQIAEQMRAVLQLLEEVEEMLMGHSLI